MTAPPTPSNRSTHGDPGPDRPLEKPSATKPPIKTTGTYFIGMPDTNGSAKVKAAPIAKRKKYTFSGNANQGPIRRGDEENSQMMETASRARSIGRPKRRVSRIIATNRGATPSSTNRLQDAHSRSGDTKARLFLSCVAEGTLINEGASIEKNNMTTKNMMSATAIVG